VSPATGSAARHLRNPRGEGYRLRQELITAADHLLRTGETIESLSLRAVARAVGIAATSVYLHFDDKASLLLAVYQRHFADLAEALNRAIAEQDEPAARLRAMTLTYRQFAVDYPDTYQVLFTMPGATAPSGLLGPGAPGPGAPILDIVRQVIAECMDAGLIHPGDPYQVALCLWAMLHGLITLRATRPQVAWPDQDALFDAVLTTILCPAPASG
jgi:AcrR family transcriptional regulator